MTRFPEWPATRGIGADAEYVELLEDYTYADGPVEFWVVPAGFVTNMASVPRLVWSLIGPYDLGPAAIHHDWLYHRQGRVGVLKLSRRACDGLFEGMILETPGIPRWKAYVAYKAVRWFGRSSWKR